MNTVLRYTGLVAVPAVLAACGRGEIREADAADSLPPTPVEQEFTASLTGGAERPDTVATKGRGDVELRIGTDGFITYKLIVNDLSSTPTGAHIHGPAGADGNADVVAPFTLTDSTLTSGEIASGTITTTSVPGISLDSLKALLRSGDAYVQVHTKRHPKGEVRGQIRLR
jgi:hypothetical protein